MRGVAVVTALLAAGGVGAADLTVATFNTESASDTHWLEIARVIRTSERADVWALQEVESEDALGRYTAAAADAAGRGAHYRYIVSESGHNYSPDRRHDLLALVFNASDLRQLETIELHAIRSEPDGSRYGRPAWGHRAALISRFQLEDTGAEFYLGTVHLKCCGEHRGGPAIRAHQARLLRDWANARDVPVIFAGDFNIPIDPDSAAGNTSSRAFDRLREAFEWIRPANPAMTYCNPRYGSMLDHIFVRAASAVTAESAEVLRTDETDPGYCERDEEGGSDHRPVMGRFVFEE